MGENGEEAAFRRSSERPDAGGQGCVETRQGARSRPTIALDRTIARAIIYRSIVSRKLGAWVPRRPSCLGRTPGRAAVACSSSRCVPIALAASDREGETPITPRVKKSEGKSSTI
jgi:hypothetical protein